MNEIDIIDYLNGHCTPEKAEAIEQWIAAGPKNEAEFQRIRLIWESSGQEAIAPDPDLDQAWAKVSARALKEAKTRRLPVWWQRVAAAVVLLIIGYSSYLLAQKPEMVTFSSAGRELPAQVELPDGTTVWLNHHSTITYPEAFSGKTRPVELVGEAYFEVERIVDQPFTISAAASEVKVLGTTFNVMAYPDSAYTRVDVSSGRVAFYPEKAISEQLILSANESAVYRKGEGRMEQLPEPDQNQTAWKEGKLRFSDRPVAFVIKNLETIYNVAIKLADPTAEQCILTAEMPLNDLASSIDILQFTLNFEVEQVDDRTYVLRGGGCK